MKKILFILVIFAVVGCNTNTTVHRGAPVDSSIIKDACYLNIKGEVVALHTVAAVERGGKGKSRITLTSGVQIWVYAVPSKVLAEMEKCKRKLNEPDKSVSKDPPK